MLRFDMNLVWTVVNILILYFLVKRFLFQPVNKILKERQALIDKQFADVHSAENGIQEKQALLDSSLDEIDRKRSEVLAEARSRAGAEYERIVSDAREQAGKILADAQVEAQQRQARLMAKEEAALADLVVTAAAKIAAAKVDVEADRELYNRFINQAKQAGMRK